MLEVVAAPARTVDVDGLRARAVPLAVALGSAAITMLAAHGDLGRPAVVLAMLLGTGLAVLASRHPDIAAISGFAVVAVVPIYWAQPLPVLPLAATPALLTSLVLLPAALGSREHLRLTALDGLVALFFALSIAALVANVDGKVSAVGDLAARTILPYVAFRLLSARPGGPRRLASTLAVAAVPLALIGIREADGHGNPFFTAVRPGFEAGQWIRSQVRFGHVRAEASFGHAIAFSLFLALALLLLLGLSWQTTQRGRALAIGASAAVALALLDTGSRGGLLSLILGAALFSLTLRGPRTGLLVVAGIVAAGLLLTPAGAQATRLRESVNDTGEAGAAVQYRLEIAHIVSDPHSFSVLGTKSPAGLGAVNAAKEALGLRTIDSQYALVYVTTGAVGLLSFAAIGLTLLALTVRRRFDPLQRAWVAATAATAVALLTVALFTQMLTLFWIAVAVTATIASTPHDA